MHSYLDEASTLGPMTDYCDQPFTLGLSGGGSAAIDLSNDPPVRRRPGRPRVEEIETRPYTTAEEVAEGLREVIKKSARSFLAIGQELIRRKEEVGHGEFSRLFKGHAKAILNPLPMSQRQAQRHMQVANDQRISRHFHRLPCDLETLGILARLSTSDFEDGILSGRIHDSLTRAQARQLVEGKLPTPKEAASKPASKPVGDDTVSSVQDHAKAQRLLGFHDPVVTKKIRLAVWRMLEEFAVPNERVAALTALDAIRPTLR